MARDSRAFPCRMAHALSPELIDYAAETGMNCVVVATSGHKGGSPKDDPAVFFNRYRRFKPIRRRAHAAILAERRRVRDLIARAHKAGMKAIYHTYELSMPYGFQQAYPEFYSAPIREYVRQGPREVKGYRELCIARPEVRQAIVDKVEELCRAYGDLDGFMYTNNESSSTTKVWHRCESCRDIPYPQTMKMLHDAFAEGIRRSGRPIQLMYRFWGANDTDEHYWQANKWRVDFGVSELPDKSWLKAWVDTHAPANLHFRPSRDIPRFVKLLEADAADTVFVYKATWGDTNLHTPLNPVIGEFKGRRQVCEVSFEHCSAAPRAFYVMGREMQRRARLCRRRGVDGLCMVPIHWGENELIPSAYTPSRWMLAELNIFLLAALMRNAETDIQKATLRYLKRRYGKALPAELATMLLDSEDVAHATQTLRGIRATGSGFANFYYELIRYAPMFPDWRKMVYPTPANLKRIWKDKDDNVRKARAMVERTDQLKGHMPRKAYREFRECFGNLLASARRMQAAHKYHMTLWGLREGTIQPTTAELEKLNGLVEDMHRQGRQQSANTRPKP